MEYNINNDFRAANTVFIVIPDQSIDKFCCRSGIRACLKIEEMTDICSKMVSFKEKTQSNRSLTRLFDAEDDRLGAKIRRFRFFKQALILWQHRAKTALRALPRIRLHLSVIFAQNSLKYSVFLRRFGQSDEKAD